MRPTIDERMIETGGRSTGFDYMRILLAASVIGWHAFGVSYGLAWTYSVEDSLARPLIMIILPMFFALSGFLVAGSLVRNPALSTFLGLRAMRIFPALVVETLLSAWVIGPLLTRTPLPSYFSDPLFFRYHLNILGEIHYKLPGLFLNNPIPGIVNGQLSTVPWELRCYIALTVLAVFGLVKHKRVFFGVVVLASLAFLAWKFPGSMALGFTHNNVGGANLLFAFLAGVWVYTCKGILLWDIRLAVLSALALIVMFLIPGFDYLCAFPAAYLTVYLGLLNPRKIWILRGADYSYGLYLYGYVIQQAVAQLGPWARHWYVNLPISLTAASIFAAFSWHCVEKPALKLKRYLPALEGFFARIRLPGMKSKLSDSRAG